MTFAVKSHREATEEMTVKQLKEFLTSFRIPFPSGARKAALVNLVLRYNRPLSIERNYTGFEKECTPRQKRRIRKARNRAKGMVKK